MQDRDPDDDRPSADLLAAIDEAARSVGAVVERPAGEIPPTLDLVPIRLRFDAERPTRHVALVLAVVLATLLAAGSFVLARAREEPPPERVEADLRWAVAQVVRRVETLRSQTGRLPRMEDLQGLTSDLVVYEPLADGYWVHGQRGPVRVEFDGSVPLERWLQLRER